MKFKSFKDKNDVMSAGIEKKIVSDAFAYRKNKKRDPRYFIGYETDKTIIQLMITQLRKYFSVFIKPSTCQIITGKVENYLK